MSDETDLSRRQLLRYTGAGGLALAAGCSGDGGSSGDGGGGDGGATATATDAGTETAPGTASGDISRGGKPVIGLSNSPRGFNPLVISDAAAFAIIDQMYPQATARDPSDPANVVGYVFDEFSFDSESLEGTATVREGFAWSDGSEFTAEDVAWSFNYMMDNEGHRYQQNVANFETFEATGDYEVRFTLAQETAAVFTPDTGMFAVPIMPRATWEGVDNYEEFDPFQENGELLGANGWRWVDSDEGNWYELEAMPDSVPDGLHEGPYVDRLRFRVYGDMTSLINALRNGDVDMTYESITPNRAFQLQDADGAEVFSSQSRGYNYIAHNMRRVPLDDKSFRQSLGFVFPYNYLQSTLRRNLTEVGSYASAKAYEDWWPDSHDEPIEHGPYRTESGELDVERAREFLRNADGAHEYTFGSVESSQIQQAGGDAEIRVDGELLTDAHTDNDGNPGQGPLGLVVAPPSRAPVESRAAARFVENLNKVGIPAETRPTAENTMSSLVRVQEDFDMWMEGWVYMPQPHFYMSFWLTSDRADVASESDSVALNPMGYTNADEKIAAVHNTYDPEAQKQAAAEALAQVYEDQPALITEYPNRLHATSTAFDGWVKLPGGISQTPWTYLNVHQAQD
jgi:peptide/nickel transport system substrate-binding protein